MDGTDAKPLANRRRRRAYTDDVRARALALVAEVGVSRAAAELAIPKATVGLWARSSATTSSSDLSRRTAAATAARVEQLTASSVARLEYLIELASTGLIRRLEANADASEVDAADLTYNLELERYVGLTPEADAAIRRYRYLETLEPTRDLVGALTRALGDLAAIRGEVTERGNIVVQFGIPRPVDDGDVLELTAI